MVERRDGAAKELDEISFARRAVRSQSCELFEQRPVGGGRTGDEDPFETFSIDLFFRGDQLFMVFSPAVSLGAKKHGQRPSSMISAARARAASSEAQISGSSPRCRSSSTAISSNARWMHPRRLGNEDLARLAQERREQAELRRLAVADGKSAGYRSVRSEVDVFPVGAGNRRADCRRKRRRWQNARLSRRKSRRAPRRAGLGPLP